MRASKVVSMPASGAGGGHSPRRTGGGSSGGGTGGSGAGDPGEKARKAADLAWRIIKAPGFKGWGVIFLIFILWSAFMKVKSRVEGVTRPAARAGEIAEKIGANFDLLRKRAIEKKFDREIKDIKEKVENGTATPEEVDALERRIEREVERHEPVPMGGRTVWTKVEVFETPAAVSVAEDDMFAVSADGPIKIEVEFRDGSSQVFAKEPGDNGKYLLSGSRVNGITGNVARLSFAADRKTAVKYFTRKY